MSHLEMPIVVLTYSLQNAQKGSKRLPGPNGVGLNKALHGYAKWFKDIYLPGGEHIPD